VVSLIGAAEEELLDRRTVNFTSLAVVTTKGAQGGNADGSADDDSANCTTAEDRDEDNRVNRRCSNRGLI
jgi:hypothetical protein